MCLIDYFGIFGAKSIREDLSTIKKKISDVVLQRLLA